MEWIREQVTKALQIGDVRRLKFAWEPQHLKTFLGSKSAGSILLLYLSGTEVPDEDDTLVKELGVAHIVKSSLNGLPTNTIEKDAVYFLRNTDGLVSSGSVATRLVDFGTIRASSLEALNNVTKQIYAPSIFSGKETTGEGIDTKNNFSEFRLTFQKFVSQMQHALQQTNGDAKLDVPDVEITDPSKITDDWTTCSKLESALEVWGHVIQEVISEETGKHASNFGQGPLSEIEFWKNRNAALSALFEKLHSERVQNMLEVLRLIDAPGLNSFNFHFQELNNMFVEAKDNVKFLSTLERHFKNIHEGNICNIKDTLPSMMNGIRMVWIISRHYNTDERMVFLMELVAKEIARRCGERVRVPGILLENPKLSTSTIVEVRDILTAWETTYRNVRERIEKSGADKRWEFDKKRLFEKTTHMARICGDLLEITQALDQFQKFLGPELKAVTGDSEGIDTMMREVQKIVEPFLAVKDAFDESYKSSWDAVMKDFRERVVAIEAMTKIFINSAFENLKSSEAAFDLLQKFQNIESRETINRQMMEKFDDILGRYNIELDIATKLFREHKVCPPAYKNYPKVAGAIAWAHSLFLQVKKPIMRFRSMESLLKSDRGELVKGKYIELAKTIDEYVHFHYKTWSAHVAEIAAVNLRVPVLGPPGKVDSAGHFQLPAPPYKVNFSRELVMLIRESKSLDKMGFFVPEAAANVSLQEEKFASYVQQLESMLARYHRVFDSLIPVERIVLGQQLAELQESIRPGFDRLNWNSLHVPTFLVSCNAAIQTFSSRLTQVRKQSASIETILDTITKKDLVLLDEIRGNVSHVATFYDKMETIRTSQLNVLVEKYKCIGSILLKVESLVVGTGTCSSPSLREYYKYWERRVYNAITQTILKALATLQQLFLLPGAFSNKNAGPICEVKATMNGRDVGLSPNLSDLSKYFRRIVKNVVESSKNFTRWNDGSCIISEPIHMGDFEPVYVHSFHEDICINPLVAQMQLKLNTFIQQAFENVNKYLLGWTAYDEQYGLWDSKRKGRLLKLKDSMPSLNYFDSRLSVFNSLSKSVNAKACTKQFSFLQLDTSPLISSISGQALYWRDQYGSLLLGLATEELNGLSELYDEYRKELDVLPTDLLSLKRILNQVKSITEIEMEMGSRLAVVVEQFRLLRQNGVHIPTGTGALADGIIGYYPAKDEAQKCGEMLANRFYTENICPYVLSESIKVFLNPELTKWQVEIDFSISKKWDDLRRWSKTREMRLEKVKIEFTEVTKVQVKQFADKIKETFSKFDRSGPGVPGTELEDGLVLMSDFSRELNDMKLERDELVNAEVLFGLEYYFKTGYPEIGRIDAEMKRLSQIYNLYADFKNFVDALSDTLWSNLDISVINGGTENFLIKLKRTPSELKTLSTYRSLEEKVLSFRDGVPVIEQLKNDALEERHWVKLMDITGCKFDLNPKKFTLGNLFEAGLSSYVDEIGEIVVEAMQEMKIQNELKKIEEGWRDTCFSTKKYGKSYVLLTADDIKLDLEDGMLNLQTMSGSRYAAAYISVIRNWEKKFEVIGDTIEIWFRVQSKWMYLESIFIGAEDIRQQLPEEAKKFDNIDKTFKGIMAKTQKDRNVVRACHEDKRYETLEKLASNLDSCQKSLSDYLNTKRASFPRFYYISDDELLSVLGTSDPTAIQEHLMKLFTNVKYLRFARANKIVSSMGSSEGEFFEYRMPPAVDGPVENWMTTVENEMQNSLRQITKEGVFSYAKEVREEWVEKCLGMVGLCGSQIWWTWETEDTFRKVKEGDKYAMKNFLTAQNIQLIQLVAKVREKLSRHMRKKANTLLIVDVHARDIIDKFVRDSILDAREFAWESQLRFYWDRDCDDAEIRQCTGRFDYGYEFYGLAGRLVITPLTDRCIMTLTQALTFNLGGSPAGPAGTGKTETVKDLAKGLAIACFVVNCGEGLDYRAMGNIYAGLAMIGAWGCFDEFNRINVEVLSVVAAQIYQIQTALNFGRNTCDIGIGREIYVKKTVGIFVTMNPGYAGRTELPDNLKALFRPVTMVVPDLLQICMIMLFSEGFEDAFILGKKMTTLYKLAKEQLSKQYHYDWGLRALKSVLVLAGSLKREFSDMTEELVLFRALRDMNAPKFIFEDAPLFAGLLADLFPGLHCPRLSFEKLKIAIELDFEQTNKKSSEADVFYKQVDKTIQIYETFQARHTIMVVGPTGGGKSVCIEALQRSCLPAFNDVVKTWYMNAKAQSLVDLYGEMDPVTRDWTDGILSNVFRNMNRPLITGKENEKRWLIFDGDVDALWIENMNSVMDDNKLLTLPNGERIQLQPFTKLAMETFDLQYASPATISRCGMVWVDPKNLGYQPYYEAWARDRSNGDDDIIATLMDSFHSYVKKCILYTLEGIIDGKMKERPSHVIPITSLGMVNQFCNLMNTIAPAAADGITKEDIEAQYVFCCTWAFGGTLVDNSRGPFDEFLKSIAGGPTPSSSFFQSFYDMQEHRWVLWQDIVPKYVQPAPFEYSKVIVPTSDSTLYAYLLKSVVISGRPVLMVGLPGTAKTVTVQHYFNSLNEDKSVSLTINMSSRTSGVDVRTSIEDSTDKRSGKIYGPAMGKQLYCFIDDLNMPFVDTYGTQQPIALLLFLISRNFMYDYKKDLDVRTYRDMNYIGAMGPPGGGRNPVDPRLVQKFSVFNMTPPTEMVLGNIFEAILKAYLEPFGSGVKDEAKKLTKMTLDLYTTLMEKLPATPSKFHYIFNLRDLGRVYQGICQTTEDKCVDRKSLVRLWKHEIDRVFGDRLISDEDLKLLDGLVAKLVKNAYGQFADSVLQQPCLFGDFELAAQRLVEDAEDPRLYGDMGTFVNVRGIFDEILELYNAEKKPMTLVLFEMALTHLTRIHRLIRMPGGHAMLVGVGGSGKQSLSKLATFSCGYSFFEVSLTRGYGETEFREDLKELFKMLATGPTSFLFTDAHVAEESFLENVNNILSTGMVPALFASDEKDALCSLIREEASKKGIIETPDNLWKYFLGVAKNNLHVILAMSPSGETLRVRCRNFPGLVSSTTIDWFFKWPDEALKKVSEFFLQDESSIPNQFRDPISSHMVLAHTSVMEKAEKYKEELRRYYYVTPKNYLDFIANYRQLLRSNFKKSDLSIRRLGGGLAKLEDAATAVDKMSAELAAAKKIVDAKTVDVKALILNIEESTKVANENQIIADAKSKDLAAQAIVIAVEKEKAEEALGEALPALEAAAEALRNINKDDINELKSFANPPKAVNAVTMCVQYLKPTGKENPSAGWAGAKVMMGQGNFLHCLMNYEKDKIKDSWVKPIKKYFKDAEFNVESMKSKSKAAAGMLQWVVAIVKYHEVAKNVEPLRAKVRAMEKAVSQGQKELDATTKLLKELASKLNELDVAFKRADGELKSLVSEAAIMEKRLEAASSLIKGLSSERTRWGKDKEALLQEKGRIVGDSLLGASFLSYLGAFTFEYRELLSSQMWAKDVLDRKIPVTTPFRLEDMLTSDAEKQMWASEGLPSDSSSTQNGMVTVRSSRFPVCIDPQQQAVTWIKNRESKRQLKVKTFNESDFMKHLELAVQFGAAFLFENVGEYIDPMIDPILEKNTYMQGPQKMILLGDKAIEWDDDFRLYLTTKLANPHYSPEIMGKTMIINYGVTMNGLAAQLLDQVVGHERPDLAIQFKQLVDEMSAMANTIVELEDNLLKMLADSTGNILDNEELIGALAETKEQATEISIKLEESTKTKEELNATRLTYMSTAMRGSILYFSVARLIAIMNMYETSLNSFLVVFLRSLRVAKRDQILEKRLGYMTEEVTAQVYNYTCTGLFEIHKLMYSFQMCSMIMDDRGSLVKTELDFFLKGDQSLEQAATPNPCPWLSAQGWKDLIKLATVADVFEGIDDLLVAEMDEFKIWYDKEMPESESFPCGFSKRLSAFQKLLLIRCFRPDRSYNAISLFISNEIGQQFVQPPVLDYKNIYAQSSATIPMVFILSPGADPANDIQKLSVDMEMDGNKFKAVSLGQGQGPVAKQYLETGCARGHWVLLQNCHLLLSWMPFLEAFLEHLSGPHKAFRLWLTTDPTDRFPMGILQRALKVVIEPPDGLKQNMRQTFSKITEDVLEECEHVAYRPLTFVLAYLHAVLQERRKYGKIGWNVNYDFNESDFTISRRIFGLYLQKALLNGDDQIPWGSLMYLVGDAMYGGRVSDDWDRRVLVTYAEEYMGDFIFDNHNRFYFSRVGYDYKIPVQSSAEAFRAEIEDQPLISGPAVFGLHPNAEIEYFLNASRTLWSNILAMLPRTGGSGGGMSRDEYITSVANDILTKIPDVKDMMNIRKTLPLVLEPTQIVLMQELERWNKLVAKMGKSLVDLQRAMIGEIGMSDSLDELGASLFNGQVPSMFKTLAPMTEKPLGSWILHFVGRADQFDEWCDPDRGEPPVLWLAGLHIPASYLTALVQQACRIRGWPLDKSTLFTAVTRFTRREEITEKLEMGCFISGLKLEGATWDESEMCLAIQKPKVLVTDLPFLQILPIELSKLKENGQFETPVYVTPMRANAMQVGGVFTAYLSSEMHASLWTLQGVCLTLNTNS